MSVLEIYDRVSGSPLEKSLRGYLRFALPDPADLKAVPGPRIDIIMMDGTRLRFERREMVYNNPDLDPVLFAIWAFKGYQRPGQKRWRRK